MTSEEYMGLLRQASDAELVQLIHKNPPSAPEGREAIGILYDRYHERIFRYLWVRSSSSHQAEDLTGEVFTRMVAFLPRYRHRQLPLLAWLYRIAHNLLVDQYRRTSLRQSVSLDEMRDLPVEDHDLASFVENRMLAEEVRSAIERLDALKKEVIVLRFLIGLPIKDVALIMDKTVPTIKTLQHRGLSDLRSLLETA